MKSIKYLILAAAAAFAVSCADKEPEYQIGEADLDGCYGVYFPKAGGSETLDPAAEAKVSFTVARTESKGDITVPVNVSASHEGIFNVGELKFEDGQAETTIDVTFPDAEDGVNYSLTLSIDDPVYASRYIKKPLSLNYSVMRVSWLYFGVDAEGKETVETDPAKAAKITWAQGIWGEEHTGIVKYYELGGVRTCFTVTDPLVENGKTAYGFWGQAPSAEYDEKYELKFYWYLTPKEKTDVIYFEDPQYVYYEEGYTADCYWADNYLYYNFFSSNYKGGWPDAKTFFTQNPTIESCSYDHNGVFNFPTYGICLEGTTLGIWGKNADDNIVGTAEGFIHVDYSLKTTAGFANNGKLPVQFKTGIDVAAVKYAVYEGVLLSGDAQDNAKAIAEGKEQNVQTVAVENGMAAVEIELEKTGVYTLVAVAFDADGNAQANEIIHVDYVAANEEVPVVVNCGLGSAAKYAPQGISSDVALEFYVYGKDIKEARIGLFSLVDMLDVNACVSALLKTKPIAASAIEAINGDGYVNVMKGLLPGTQYTLLVWASNGYEQTIIASDPMSTTGDPLPVYQNFGIGDINGELLPEKSEGYFGAWNFYAVDVYTDNPLREYMGQVVIADSDIPDEAPDEDGIVEEYVTVSGLFGGPSKYIASDDMVFSFYDGLLYYISGQEAPGAAEGLIGGIYVGDADQNKWGYGAGNAFVGAMVEDGYLAFIANPGYASQGFAFNGLCMMIFQGSSQLGWYSKIYDILLVDPAKDNNGLAPAKKAAAYNKMAGLKKAQLNAPLVLNDEGRMEFALENMKSEPKVVGTVAGVKNASHAGSSVKVSARKVEVKAVEKDSVRSFTKNTRSAVLN